MTSDSGSAFEDVFINNRLVSHQNASSYMFAKVTEIFRYTNLPLTVPKRILERYLTRNGHAVAYMHDGELFISDELPTGKPNLYGEDTEVTIAHDVGDNADVLTKTIGVDAVLIRNDSDCIGLEPIVTEYAAMTAQAKITVLRNLVDLRSHYIIQAKDQKSYESAVAYEEAVRSGDTAVILAEEFATMDGLIVHSTPIANNPATQTIELFQYINSLYYGELGIDINNNMKREYVSDSEIQKSSGMPLIVNMLQCRLDAVMEINALFDLNIKVCLSEEWNDEEEIDNATESGHSAVEGEPGANAAGGTGGEDPDAGGSGEAAGACEAEGEGEAHPVHPEDAVEQVSKEEVLEAAEALGVAS